MALTHLKTGKVDVAFFAFKDPGIMIELRAPEDDLDDSVTHLFFPGAAKSEGRWRGRGGSLQHFFASSCTVDKKGPPIDCETSNGGVCQERRQGGGV